MNRSHLVLATLIAASFSASAFAETKSAFCTLHADRPSEHHSKTFQVQLKSKGKTTIQQTFMTSTFKLAYDAKTEAATLSVSADQAGLAGEIQGLMADGKSLEVGTINDYDFGDGSDASVECMIGYEKQPETPPTEIVCSGKDWDGKSHTGAIPIAQADGASVDGLDISVTYKAESGTFHLWPNTGNHGGVSGSGYGTEKYPLTIDGVSCFLR